MANDDHDNAQTDREALARFVGISREAFAAGMYALASNYRRHLTEYDISAAYDTLRGAMTDSEWSEVVARTKAVQGGLWAPEEALRRALREIRAENVDEAAEWDALIAAERAEDRRRRA